MKRSIRITAAALSAAILLQGTAFAADFTKEEIAYITLDSSGRPQQTVIVNSFKTNGNTSITDYGVYKNIKNLTSTEKPVIKDGQIKWNNIDTDTFYYQGEKDGGELPWNFSISYMLDGKPLSGEEMIGKSGRASITIKADINNSANKYYTENYMAQITMVLDSEKASDVICDKAITATVGSNKQLTFMVLPSRSKTFTVNFNAHDFEMDGLTIAALKLSDGLLGNTLDNASTTMSGVSDGIQSLLDGSGLLKNGADDLVSGIAILNSGAQSIESTVPVLTSGMSTLNSGIWDVSSGLTALSSASSEIRGGLMELDAKSADISNGISALEGGLSEMTKHTSEIKRGLAQLRSKKQSVQTLADSGAVLVDGYRRVNDGAAQIAQKKQDISDGLDTLHTTSTDISALSDGADTLGQGMETISGACDTQMQILDALIQMSAQNPELAQMTEQLQTVRYISQNVKSGAQSAQSGASQLANGARTAQEGINTLYTAADNFGNAALAMADGAQTVNTSMNTLNSALKEYTDGAASASALYDSAETFGKSALSMAEGAQKLENGTRSLSEGFSKYAEGLGTLAGSYIEFDNGLFAADRGAQELKGGTDSAMSGVDTICSVVNELCDGIDTLNSASAALPNGAQQLEDGTKTLYDGISGVDIAALLTKGRNAQAVSYAAPYTAHPEKVQFLMKTPNLHEDDEKADDVQEVKTSFWQKLIGLFRKK